MQYIVAACDACLGSGLLGWDEVLGIYSSLNFIARQMPTILLTGAAGYIASHTWLALLSSGFTVVGLDNFSNSSSRVLDRLAILSGGSLVFEELDVCDMSSLDGVFCRHRIDAVIHFAAFKSVGDSILRPLDYYENNIGGLLKLCSVMRSHAVSRLVFSSSATVYGKPERLPISETAALGTTNPYGATKLMGERIVRDLGHSDPTWQAACLRYFNPVGAHESGLIGEDPRGTPSNLMPFVAQVAVRRREILKIFGGDYPTVDGTGVRDYIHVQDLAEGHVAALRALFDMSPSFTVNLGTGRGYSVLELVRAYEAASGCDIPYQIVDRREGDVPACYADPTMANRLLGWRATRDLRTMCLDSWRWQRMNPDGYESNA